jgi:hypothetical protein
MLIHLFVLGFLSYESTFAQSTSPIIAMSVTATPIANYSIDGLPYLTDSTIFNLKMKVTLSDTLLIDQINVLLSDTDTSGNRLQHTFHWDVFGTTGNNTSYQRTEYDVLLDLGNFNMLLRYVASVRIKRLDGNYTDLVNFSR